MKKRKFMCMIFIFSKLQRVLAEFKVDCPEVDSPGVVRTWKPGHYSSELPEDV